MRLPLMKSLAIMVACLPLMLPAFGAPPTIANAADGIFAAFRTHPLVGLGEAHGLAQELDFYAVLVRDPRFAKEVGNIVLETGDAAHQAVVDRYVNGENVPYRELRQVWSDTVGYVPTVQYLGSINLYAVIRAVNLSLPPESRIKVWLGEPPIDWSQIKTRADWRLMVAQRGSYPVALVEREILGKGKKALLIYGYAHFANYPGGLFPDVPASENQQPNIRFLLDSRHPGAFHVVTPFMGYTTAACTAQFEKTLPGLSAPSLISPIRGSSLEDLVTQPGCTPYARPPGSTQAQWEAFLPSVSGFGSDALLYLGPRKSLTFGPAVPDLYLDLDFRAEIDRRQRVRTGNGLNAIPDPAYNPSTLPPFFTD